MLHKRVARFHENVLLPLHEAGAITIEPLADAEETVMPGHGVLRGKDEDKRSVSEQVSVLAWFSVIQGGDLFGAASEVVHPDKVTTFQA